MMLCLDCGNTRLKWGLHESGQWLAGDTLSYADVAQLQQRLPTGYTLNSVIACNVAGAHRAAEIETAVSVPVRWINSRQQQCGVVNGYDNPASLGADRWAALIGARALHQGAALVVLAGTATTIDLLDSEGQHQGGLILPGLTMMTNSLALGTASLPSANGEYRALPRNTHDAISSGAIEATLGAIERMAVRLQALLADKNPFCLLSGGAADSLQLQLDFPFCRIDNLVLEGLAVIAHVQSAT